MKTQFLGFCFDNDSSFPTSDNFKGPHCEITKQFLLELSPEAQISLADTRIHISLTMKVLNSSSDHGLMGLRSWKSNSRNSCVPSSC